MRLDTDRTVGLDRSGHPNDPVAAIRDMYAAFQAGDRPGFDRHLAADTTTWESQFTRMLTRGELDRFRDARRAMPTVQRLEVDVRRAEVWGDVALVGYVLTAQIGGDVETTRVTDVLTRQDGDWRIVHHHAELRPAPEDAS